MAGSGPGRLPGPAQADSRDPKPAPGRGPGRFPGPRLTSILAGCLLALAGIAAGPVAGTASAATISVNTVGDARADDGVCSLREAIIAGNANAVSGTQPGECQAGDAAPVVDRIDFTFVGTIAPGSSLPTITEVLDVDGTGAPGEVRIDGGGALPFFTSGFTVRADGTTIEGLTITSFYRGVDLTDSDGSTVRDNLIGTDSAGTTGLGNDFNVNGDDDVTGALINDNVIADGEVGIRIAGSGSSDNVVVANRIGTDPTGTSALGNDEGISVSLGVTDTRIGGSGPAARNLISGNRHGAISIRGELGYRTSGTQILGNRVGTSLDGQSALPNGNLTTDVSVELTGGVDGSEVRGNLISGNAGSGILLSDSVALIQGADGPSDNVIAGNLVGVGADGDSLLPNGGTAVLMKAQYGHPSAGNRLGGSSSLTPGGACTGDCNVIAAVSQPAVMLSGADLSGALVAGNHIGLGRQGTFATDGGDAGVLVQGTTGTRIGQPGASNLIAAADDGIRVEPPAVAPVIQSNTLGLRSDGGISPGLRLADQGIEVGAAGALVGGTGPDRGNRIALAGEQGVLVDSGAEHVAVLGNEIAASGGLGIDLDPLGVNNNDLGVKDADAGANGLQNFPELEAALSVGSTELAGRLDSEADTDFRIEFFSNLSPDPSGHGEGEAFLGATEVSTDGQGLAEFITTAGPVETGPGSLITATATSLDPAGDPLATSEFGADLLEGDQCDPTPTTGDDVLCGTGGADLIDGLGGDDIIFGLAGGDQLDGSGGDDRILGSEGEDTLTGGSGSDRLKGGTEDDRLFSRDGGEPDVDECGGGNDEATGDEADAFAGCEQVQSDTIPPETTIDSGPVDGSGVEADEVTFGFSSNEAGSTFACGIDGAAATVCDSPHSPAGLAPGTHAFSVAATDAAGNQDPSPALVSFTVVEPGAGGDTGTGNDSKPPVLTLSGEKKQLDKKKVVVKAKCNEACDLVATGSIKVKILKRNGKLKKVRRFDLKKRSRNGVTAGVKQKLKLKFTGKTRNRLSKVIRKKKSKATVKVVATDEAGNATGKVKFRVTVKKKSKRH